MAAEKKLDEFSIKLPIEQKRKLFGLAELKGITASEAVRSMIDRFISEHEREFESMKSIFGDKERDG